MPLSELKPIGQRMIVPLKNRKSFDKILMARIAGNSLRDNDILEGDYAIIKLNFTMEDVSDERLVVVNCPAGVVIKHFHLTSDGQVRLRSANPAYPDLYFEVGDVEIQGLVMRTDRVIDWF